MKGLSVLSDYNGFFKYRFITNSTSIRATISTLRKWPLRTSLIVAIFIPVVIIALLILLPIPKVKAAPESNPPLNCLGCHTQKLEFHDTLGADNSACWVCHDREDMSLLRLADDSPLTFEDSSQLCGQCLAGRRTVLAPGPGILVPTDPRNGERKGVPRPALRPRPGHHHTGVFLDTGGSHDGHRRAQQQSGCASGPGWGCGGSRHSDGACPAGGLGAPPGRAVGGSPAYNGGLGVPHRPAADQ